jgi:hypothetical protein
MQREIRTMKLKEPLPVNWKMKPLESAKTKFYKTPGNVYHMEIEHDPIKGVTPYMLDWWFRNIEGHVIYEGRTYTRYGLWHPLDHIHWELAATKRTDGKVGVGSYFRIVESFNRNPEHHIDSIEKVVKLDHTGIRLVRTVMGIEVFSLEHWFSPLGLHDTLYRSHMVVGSPGLFGRCVFQPFIRPGIFSEEMAQAWLRHNVEEVGNFEKFLPQLYNENRVN